MSTKFVLLGNVDSGKSTLAGRLLIDTKTIDENEVNKVQREAEKNGKSSFWLAYLLDIDDTERERGITLGYTNYEFKYNDKQYVIYDVPGHKDLVQEMVTGSSHCNLAIVILSARKGEYESSLKGQTLEHVLIARGMGISSLIVCINKMDLTEWDKTIYDNIKNDFAEKIKRFRFKHIHFCPISAFNGDNVVIKKNYENSESVFNLIESIPIEPSIDKYFELNNKSVIKTKFIFDTLTELITSGYNAIAHSKDKFYPIVFKSIKNDKFSFVTAKNVLDNKGNNKLIDVEIEFIDKPEKIHCNLVIRTNEKTIGLAKVYQIV
jgi:translation elongation factor EF-1alpha